MDKPLVRIQGVVIPIEWDEKGTVLSIALATNTEKELLIKEDLRGRRLYNHLQESVIVTGELMESEGKTLLSVQEVHSVS